LRRVILAISATAAALVLLLTFKSHTQSAVPRSTPAAAVGTPAPGSSASSALGTAAPSGTGTASGTPSAAAGRSTTGATAGGTAKTVTGAAWPTIYGPVQVRVTVSNGKITAVTATEYPDGTPRDYQINQFAIPQLNSEALAAGSAQIDSVSGATYTSQGYIGSLQNALDQAK